LLCCLTSSLALFREDAGDKMTVEFSSAVRRGKTNYDYTKLEVEASLQEMLDSQHSVDRDSVRLEFKSQESDWQVWEEKPTMKGGVYKWTISGLIPCHNHNVRLTVEGSQETFLYPDTVQAATMEQIIQSKYQPASPQNVKVESVSTGHLVSWSPSYCVENYDVSYRPAGESEYINTNVQGNSYTITDSLPACQEFELVVTAVVGEEFSQYDTTTFTTLPDISVSSRLNPLVSPGTASATVRWAASEKLSCIPHYEVQLCQADSGVCQPAEMMDRDDSVKFMEFSAPDSLEMCSNYKLEIRPLHEEMVVNSRVVEFRTKSQPLQDVRSVLGPVQAVLGEDQVVEITWGTVPCAENYQIYHRDSRDLPWTRLASSQVNKFSHQTKSCTRSYYGVAVIIDNEESDLVEFDEEIFTDVKSEELPVIDVVEKANGSMIFVLKAGDLNTLCQVDRLHIKHPGGDQFYEMADLENDKISINIEETESIEGRVHYSHQEENDWSPWVSSDSPAKEKQILKQMNFLLPVIIGSVVGLVLVITVILVVLKSKKGQAKYDSEKANGTTDESKKLNDSSEEKIINGKK